MFFSLIDVNKKALKIFLIILSVFGLLSTPIMIPDLYTKLQYQQGLLEFFLVIKGILTILMHFDVFLIVYWIDSEFFGGYFKKWFKKYFIDYRKTM
jgi:hypothetical protein